MVWVSFSIKIKNVAFKDIRPLEMEVSPEMRDVDPSLSIFRNSPKERVTGKWIIKFRFDKGPMTAPRVKIIQFDTVHEAQWWFSHVWHTVFNRPTKQPPPTSPPKTKKKVLKFTGNKGKGKKKSHLRLV